MIGSKHPGGVNAVDIGVLLVIATVVLTTFGIGSAYAITVVLQVTTWAVLAVSWNLFSGNTGYPSFGHGVFFGIGIYAASAVLVRTDWPFPIAMLVASAAAGVVALLLGLATLSSSRFSGALFGLVTLALAFIVLTIVSNVPFLDGGAGVFVRDRVEQMWVGQSLGNLLILAGGILMLTCVLALLTKLTRWGSALRAIKDDEDVAESFGVPTYRIKVLTFTVTAALAGLIGAPQAAFLGYVETATVFSLSVPLFVIMMAILGGVSTWYGPLIGAVLITLLREVLLAVGSPEIAQIIIGAFLVVVIAVLPKGITAFRLRTAAAR